jgi:trans-aconitate 2-methyltransferase
MSWSAKQYSMFEDERTRPVRDLLSALPPIEARSVVDLGCGPGNSTEVLAARFPNAAVRGIDSSADMIETALVARLASGGGLAVQMPDNLDDPAHRLMREIAADGPWAGALAAASTARTPMGSAEWYYELLRPLCAKVDVWRTTYYHPLSGGPAAIVEWFKGSGLKAFLEPLDTASRAAYLERYTASVALAYPAWPDGSVLLPFPRLFMVAIR